MTKERKHKKFLQMKYMQKSKMMNFKCNHETLSNLQHLCNNQRNMAKHILIKGKSMRNALPRLEKQDQWDKLLLLRTILKSISYLRK